MSSITLNVDSGTKRDEVLILTIVLATLLVNYQLCCKYCLLGQLHFAILSGNSGQLEQPSICGEKLIESVRFFT